MGLICLRAYVLCIKEKTNNLAVWGCDKQVSLKFLSLLNVHMYLKNKSHETFIKTITLSDDHNAQALTYMKFSTF